MKHLIAIVVAATLAGWAFADSASPLRKESARRMEAVDTRTMGVARCGQVLYCIAGDALYALDISEPCEPKLLGRLPGMDNRRQLTVADGFAYVVSRETGLRIVDVRDPRAMKLCSRYDTVEFATGIDVVGKTAFLSERIYGVEVVDVSDPFRPRHLGLFKTDESQSNRYADGYLYSGEWGASAVTVFDARDLLKFRPVHQAKLGGFGDGVEIAGRYLYCSTGHDARHHHAMELGNDATALTGAGRGLEIFDRTDPARPRFLSRVNFPVFKPRNEDFWTVRVAAGFAFCCDSHNGFFVVDVANPATPRLVDRFCVPQPNANWPSGAISSVCVGDGCVYVTSFPGGLWVIPAPDVRPEPRQDQTLPANASCARTYETDTRLFHVYRPERAGQARTVCLRGDMAYVAFGDAGLHVLALREGNGFEKLGELPGNRRVTDCCLVGDCLVTAEGVDGWCVYRLDGPAKFREVARRKTKPAASVAFWCWPLDGERIVLSSRNAPYEIVRREAFSDPASEGVMRTTCQWDKYLPDGRLGDRLPVMLPSLGLVWTDFSGTSPRETGHDRPETHPIGNQANGICRFRSRYLLTVRDCYQFVSPEGVRSELQKLPAFSESAEGAPFSGIPRSDGRLVALTNRSRRRCAVYDFSDPEKPRPRRQFTLSGNPDLAAFWHGRLIVPAGHQGLLMSVESY